MPIKPKMKHRTVGPRKGTGSIILKTICAPGRRKKYRLQLDKDTYEYFVKHGELPNSFKGFTVRDFIKKPNE